MEDAANVAMIVALLSALVQAVLERIRSRFPNLDGDIVVLLAVVIGTGLAWGYGIQGGASLGWDGLPASLDYIATGIAISGVSGILSASKNAKRAQDPTSSLHSNGD